MGYKANKWNIVQNSNSLYDRVEKLLESLEWSDCCFSISGKNFKAHKLIMSISSPVFKAMFFGPLSTNKDIVITDIEPDAFQLLLNYIYTDKVNISSIEQAFGLLYASRKYMLEPLGAMCISYIQAHLSIDNVSTVLNYADFMQEKELSFSAMKIYCEHAHYLLKENRNISLSCMKDILEKDHINIAEKDLIEHVFNWVVQYCEQNDLPKTLEKRREILINHGIFKRLRFFSLSSDELDEIFAHENNVLLPLEKDAFRGKSKGTHIDNKAIVDYVCCTPTPRNTLTLESNFCYRYSSKSVPPIIIDSNSYEIHTRLKTNKSVFITSLRVPTRLEPVENFQDYLNHYTRFYSEQISISVVRESDNSIVGFTNLMNKVEYDSTMDINLSEPCYIKKEKWYKISFTWQPNVSVSHKYVVEYRNRFYNQDDIKIIFEDISTSSKNNGSFLIALNFCL